MKISDYTFDPWAAAGGSRVVASERIWKDAKKWNREADFCRCVGWQRQIAIGSILGAPESTCLKCGKPIGHRPRVFVASMADVFEDWDGPIVDAKGDRMLRPYLDSEAAAGVWSSCSPEQFGKDMQGWSALTMSDVRARLFRLIDDCPNLDFILLTKRPERIRDFWIPVASKLKNMSDAVRQGESFSSPLFRNNAWLLTSIANQEDADRNIPELLKCRELSPVLGVSAEPLIGPVDLQSCLDLRQHDNPLGWHAAEIVECIDWCVAGGESGPNARPCRIEWIRSIRDQCKAAGVPCFVKQLGAKPMFDVYGDDHEGLAPRYRIGGLTDPKGGDPSEWPEDLRVREFPR